MSKIALGIAAIYLQRRYRVADFRSRKAAMVAVTAVVAAAVIMAVVIVVVVMVTAIISAAGIMAAAIFTAVGTSPFILRTSFILAPFVLRATHEFRRRPPALNCAHSPAAIAILQRYIVPPCGPALPRARRLQVAVRTVQRRRLVAARQWRIRLGRPAVLAVRLFRHL